MTGVELVTQTLGSYAGVVSAEMGRYLSGGERPDLRRYLYDLVSDYPRRWGKMMRPSICLATAQAFGASMETALPSAASIELLHNSLLIHDDIEDESDERRPPDRAGHLSGARRGAGTPGSPGGTRCPSSPARASRPRWSSRRR